MFLADQNQPFGMALVEGTFYVGNTDGIVAFDYQEGATRIEGRAAGWSSSRRTATGRAA